MYCGSSTHPEGGPTRLDEQDAYFERSKLSKAIQTIFTDLADKGYTRCETSILAVAEIPKDGLDFMFLRAYILILGATLTVKLWFFKTATYGTGSNDSLWNQAEVVHAGIYSYAQKWPHQRYMMSLMILTCGETGKK